MGVNGWGWSVLVGEWSEGKMALTASIIPNPGVNIRPLTMLNALVSGCPFCRP
jgi:hypothetical protein